MLLHLLLQVQDLSYLGCLLLQALCGIKPSREKIMITDMALELGRVLRVYFFLPFFVPKNEPWIPHFLLLVSQRLRLSSCFFPVG